MQRDGLSQLEADAILAAQATSENRIQYAQDVIYNAGNLQQLLQQVDVQHEKYLTWTKPG